jgi:hypothetical protein
MRSNYVPISCTCEQSAIDEAHRERTMADVPAIGLDRLTVRSVTLQRHTGPVRHRGYMEPAILI